jgi:hypothetical protein
MSLSSKKRPSSGSSSTPHDTEKQNPLILHVRSVRDGLMLSAGSAITDGDFKALAPHIGEGVLLDNELVSAVLSVSESELIDWQNQGVAPAITTFDRNEPATKMKSALNHRTQWPGQPDYTNQPWMIFNFARWQFVPVQAAVNLAIWLYYEFCSPRFTDGRAEAAVSQFAALEGRSESDGVAIQEVEDIVTRLKRGDANDQ